MCKPSRLLAALLCLLAATVHAQLADPKSTVVLHAAHALDIATGQILSPAEILITGDRITAIGPHVPRPDPRTDVLDLGDRTLMPGLIDAHVHLFLHPGAEDLQTVEESVPQRTILAAIAARDDLLAGFTAERDMGTEGAGSADSAIRDAINAGLIPGPRLRVSGNAVDLTGGHEDANRFNPAQHVLSNADYADTPQQLVQVIRRQRKEGADFTKIYETGRDTFVDGVFQTPYQYTESELRTAIAETVRYGKGPGHGVAVHATGEPGTAYAVAAGVESVDHANQLSEATMAAMKQKGIFAVPTFAISEYFAEHAESPTAADRRRAQQAFHAAQFKLQLAAGVPMAVGSDVGPFPHGTQARELVLMAQYGMKPLEVLQADLLNGARLLGWQGKIGELKPGFYADIIAVEGNPLQDLATTQHVAFVMKGGVIFKR